jgi:alpha/beta superfamily hydrolase
VAGGFSFGAWLAVKVGSGDPRVAALVSIGTPLAVYGASHLAGLRKPIVFVQGSADEFGSFEEVAAAARACGGPVRLERIEGAGHLFTGQESQVHAAVQRFLREEGGLG